MLSKRLSGQHCTGENPLCNVVLEAPENNAHEKILFSDVLILLGQHCTGKNLVQYCPRGSRQHCTGKNPVQCCLNTFGTCSMLALRLQTKLHKSRTIGVGNPAIRSRAFAVGLPVIQSRAFGVGHLTIWGRAFGVGQPAIQSRANGEHTGIVHAAVRSRAPVK